MREERRGRYSGRLDRSQPLFYFVTREIVILTVKLARLVGDQDYWEVSPASWANPNALIKRGFVKNANYFPYL